MGPKRARPALHISARSSTLLYLSVYKPLPASQLQRLNAGQRLKVRGDRPVQLVGFDHSGLRLSGTIRSGTPP